MLGVHIDSQLNFQYHVDETLKNCSRLLFALKTMKYLGLQHNYLKLVFKSIVISKLLYASSAWWGYTTKQCKERLCAFLKRVTKLSYYSAADPDIYTLQENIDKK